MPLGYLIQFGQPFLGYRMQYDVLGAVTRLHRPVRTATTRRLRLLQR
jgi:hypothetical protein